MSGKKLHTGQYNASLVSVTPSATPTFNWDNGNVQQMQLTANVTSMTFSNGVSGGRYILKLHQNSTGGFTVAWPSNVRWASGTAPTMTATASTADILSFVYDGTVYYGGFLQNFAVT